MTINKISLVMTSIGTLFVYVILTSFGMGLVPALLIGGSLIAVNLICTSTNARKARQHDTDRELRRSAVLAAAAADEAKA